MTEGWRGQALENRRSTRPHQKHTRGSTTVTNETFNKPSLARSAETIVTSFGAAGQNQVQIFHLCTTVRSS